ncbi:hypothetical protein DZK27_01950 [Rhodobacteraceae bacterium 63075]|nr:hypothetical protein DZK27_01950 [Rhodobacteraceae bacterium 63075]
MDPAQPIFLVFERDALIAEDIIGSLRDLGPCETIHVNDPVEVPRHLDLDKRISAAFLEMRYDQVIELGLDRHLADHGARIILTIGEDDEKDAQARGWGMLVRPFTDQMIRDALADIGSR